MAIYLQITEGTKKQQVKLSSRPLFIGRSSKCHITLSDNMTSGKHLALKINNENHVVLKDLASTNGTYLNGNKIDESLLYLDDFIQIGKVKIFLLSTEMTSQELKIHQRDFERTNVTFVNLGHQLSNSHGEDESKQGLNQQQNLLKKIRKHKEQASTNLSVTKSQDTDEKDEIDKPSIVFEKDDSLEENLVADIPQISEESSLKSFKASRKEDLIQEDDNDEDEDEYEDEENSGLISKVKGLFGKN